MQNPAESTTSSGLLKGVFQSWGKIDSIQFLLSLRGKMIPRLSANDHNTPEASTSHNTLWPSSLEIPASMMVKAWYFGWRCPVQKKNNYFILQCFITQDNFLCLVMIQPRTRKFLAALKCLHVSSILLLITSDNIFWYFKSELGLPGKVQGRTHLQVRC